MNTPPDAVFDVVIVGGGIAGLSAAWYAQQAGLSYALLEAGERWGGKVYTQHVEIGHDTPLLVEHAPDGFITRKPGMMQLVRDLGIEDDLIPVNDTPQRIYVLVKGRLHPLPDGLHLLAPTKLWPFLCCGLFSWRGKLRMLCEPFIPSRRDGDDESLADFITRRLGKEALHKLGEPLLAGVYNADAHQQSILATFGNFRKIEAEHGSLIRGLRKTAKQGRAAAPALMSLRDGMGALVGAITARLGGALRLSTSVESVTRHDGGYVVHTSAGQIPAHSLIVATPASVAAAILKDAAPIASLELAKIRYSSVGSVSLAYHNADVQHPMDAYGIVIPANEGRQIDGVTYTSAKWQGRAPAGVALLRVFFGGIHTPHMLTLPEEQRLGIIRAELERIMGITAAPMAHHSAIWQDAYPQYDLGHTKRVSAIESALPHGLYLAGNAYYGVGLPDTVSASQRIIQKLCEGQHANHPI